MPRPKAAAPLLWWRGLRQRHRRKGAAAFGRGTSSVVSFVAAMNREDVVDLVVDLVDVDLDVDLVDVDLEVDLVDVDLEVDLVDVVSLSSGCIFNFWHLDVFLVFGPRLFWQYFCPAVFGASL